MTDFLTRRVFLQWVGGVWTSVLLQLGETVSIAPDPTRVRTLAAQAAFRPGSITLVGEGSPWSTVTEIWEAAGRPEKWVDVAFIRNRRTSPGGPEADAEPPFMVFPTEKGFSFEFSGFTAIDLPPEKPVDPDEFRRDLVAVLKRLLAESENDSEA